MIMVALLLACSTSVQMDDRVRPFVPHMDEDTADTADSGDTKDSAGDTDVDTASDAREACAAACDEWLADDACVGYWTDHGLYGYSQRDLDTMNGKCVQICMATEERWADAYAECIEAALDAAEVETYGYDGAACEAIMDECGVTP